MTQELKRRAVKASDVRNLIEAEYERTGGVFRLAPCWVGRPGIIVPGRRIKLQADYMNQDVAVNERWLASTTYADNGEYNAVCPEDHGLSYIVIGDRKIQLRDAVEFCGDLLLGKGRQWNVLPKFFDNWGRIPFHLHPCDEHVRDGLIGKPESYHFPVELNLNHNNFPQTYFGVDAACEDNQVYRHLARYFEGDNKLTAISNAIDLIPGTGWYMPACTLHAPGSLLTYELQVASDVTCIPESRVDDVVMPVDLLDRDLPVSTKQDGMDAVFGHILSMIRCPYSGNSDNFREHYYRPPVRVRQDGDRSQDFVIYRCGKKSEAFNDDLYSAKNTVVPGKAEWRLEENSAFGMVVLSGHGQMTVDGKEPVEFETASMFPSRYDLGGDELFIAAEAAKNLHVACQSMERLSIYQHFASDSNPEARSLG